MRGLLGGQKLVNRLCGLRRPPFGQRTRDRVDDLALDLIGLLQGVKEVNTCSGCTSSGSLAS
jgi:hypothetical protein